MNFISEAVKKEAALNKEEKTLSTKLRELVDGFERVNANVNQLVRKIEAANKNIERFEAEQAEYEDEVPAHIAKTLEYFNTHLPGWENELEEAVRDFQKHEVEIDKILSEIVRVTSRKN